MTEEIADEIALLKELMGLRGASLLEMEPLLRTIAMKGPRNTIHTRYPDHDAVLAVALMYAGNKAHPDDDGTSFDSPHVETFLVQYAVALISEGGESRKEWVKIAESVASAFATTQERIRSGMGQVLDRRK